MVPLPRWVAIVKQCLSAATWSQATVKRQLAAAIPQSERLIENQTLDRLCVGPPGGVAFRARCRSARMAGRSLVSLATRRIHVLIEPSGGVTSARRSAQDLSDLEKGSARLR